MRTIIIIMVFLKCYQLVDSFATKSTSTNLVNVIEQHKVFVAGISSTCTEQNLQSTFTKLFGPVREVLIVGQAQSTQKQKGFKPYAFVTFEDESSVQKALRSAPKPSSTTDIIDSSSSSSSMFTEIQLARPITKRKRSNASRIKEQDIINKVELLQQHANCILQVQHTHLDRLMNYLQHEQNNWSDDNNSISNDSTSCKVLGTASASSKNISLLFLNCVDPIKVTRMLNSKSELLARAINQSYIVKSGQLLEGDLVSEEGCNEFAKIIYQTIRSSQQQGRNDKRDVALRMKVFPPKFQSRLLQSFDAIIDANVNNESGKLPSISINPKEFTHILSIVEVYQSQGRGWMNNDVKNTNLYMMGLAEASLVEDVVDTNNSITTTTSKADNESSNNHRNDAAVEVCRAYYKLKEAIETYGVNNNLHQDLYRSVTALDCGSAPGGWTKYLIEHFHCSKVYSIDPGLLAPSVLNIKETHHVQMKIQDAVPLLLKKDEEDGGAARVKIWVSDMCLHNMEAQVDLLLMAKESGLLASNAFFVLTLKCIVGHSKGAYDAQVKKTVDKLFDSSKVENVETFHLFSNRSGERTVMGYIN